MAGLLVRETAGGFEDQGPDCLIDVAAGSYQDAGTKIEIDARVDLRERS